MKVDCPPRTPELAGGAAPVLGHAWRLLRDPLTLLTSLRDSGELVTIRLGRRTAYVVSPPELVGELLTNRGQSTVVGGPLWEALDDLLGQGVATTNGEVHRRQRRMIQPRSTSAGSGYRLAPTSSTARTPCSATSGRSSGRGRSTPTAGCRNTPPGCPGSR